MAILRLLKSKSIHLYKSFYLLPVVIACGVDLLIQVCQYVKLIIFKTKGEPLLYGCLNGERIPSFCRRGIRRG